MNFSKLNIIEEEMTIEKAFSNNETKKIANTLVDMIVKHEPPDNIDECLEAIVNAVAKRFDKKAGCTYSPLIIGELFYKIKGYFKKSRFQVKIVE